MRKELIRPYLRNLRDVEGGEAIFYQLESRTEHKVERIVIRYAFWDRPEFNLSTTLKKKKIRFLVN